MRSRRRHTCNAAPRSPAASDHSIEANGIGYRCSSKTASSPTLPEKTGTRPLAAPEGLPW